MSVILIATQVTGECPKGYIKAIQEGFALWLMILAGGAISLHPIDGIGSEVALMGYLVADRFLWASDFIQTVAEPTAYASEVWRAVQREGLHPERTAAEHLPLTLWSKIEELQK